MKCPKCGSSTAEYVVSRKKYWKEKSGSKGTKQREDFRAKCKKCGYEFDAKEVYGDSVVSQVKEKQPEKKGQIKMKYNGEES